MFERSVSTHATVTEVTTWKISRHAVYMDYIWNISTLHVPADAGLIRTHRSRSRFRHTARTGGSLLEIKSNLLRHGRACSLGTSIQMKSN